jgi:hypothetical protein
VYWNKAAKKYEVNVKGKYLGVFSTVDDAIKRRDEHGSLGPQV